MLILKIIIALYDNDFFLIEIFKNDLLNLLDKQDINFEQFFTLDENNQVILI